LKWEIAQERESNARDGKIASRLRAIRLGLLEEQ
jgi:hypothetical protein